MNMKDRRRGVGIRGGGGGGGFAQVPRGCLQGGGGCICFWVPKFPPRQSPHHIIPTKGPIHKSPVNQFVNPSGPPIYCGFAPLWEKKTDKSTMDGGGGVDELVRGRAVNRPLFG